MKTPDSEFDRQMLLRAVELSRIGMLENAGGPFGAIVTRGREIIGQGFNRVTSSNDPSAHAEIVAIRDACSGAEAFTLEGCTIYSSCEPCPMCLGAIYWARLKRLVFANTRSDAAAIDFDDAEIYRQLAKPFDEQKLTALHLPLDEAKAVFEEWYAKSFKIPY